MPRFAIILLLALAQRPAAAIDLDAELTPALERFRQDRRIPGLAVGIVRGGEVVYAHAFGETTRGDVQVVTTRSNFHLASLSKPVTATAAMILVEDGRLDLDAPITTYLPDFRMADAVARTITSRQILTHRSGIPDVDDYEWDRPQLDDDAAARYADELSDSALDFLPGTDSRYSNRAFDLMGHVIATIAGMPFEDFVRTRIFTPLGMDDSSFLLAEIPPERRTQGHSMSFSKSIVSIPCEVYPYNRRHAPSSTLNSNVEDMCRWMLANLAHGELQGERMLARESYRELWSRDDDTPDVGLSWWMEGFGDRPGAMHTGSDTGYRSHLVLLTDDDIGVVAMSNADDASLGAVVTAALHAVLGEDFELPGPRFGTEFAWRLESDGLDAALAFYEDADPDDWKLSVTQLDRVCRRLIWQERFDEAVTVARLNLRRHDGEARAHARLGEALRGAGDRESARSAFERALAIDPDHERAREGLQSLED